MHAEPRLTEFTSHKRRLLVGTLDALFLQIDLTDSQYVTAKDRYEAVSAWLAEDESPFLKVASIYAQGSIALGTANKPIGRAEFDVDLVCHLPSLGTGSNPAAVKALIGDRLKAHSAYASMLEEKQRCWRLCYANEFHLDITPSIPNPACGNGGELVPDRTLATWKHTNPKGYVARFEQYAALQPRLSLSEAAIAAKRAEVEDFPDQEMLKPALKRIVQLLKRHRDVAFAGTGRSELAPISIILTTLAARSYAHCTIRCVYVDTYELILDVVRRMPEFIVVDERNGRPYFFIENETTASENFADKWNLDPRLPQAFYGWHRDAVAMLEELVGIEGKDRLGQMLQKSFGASQEAVRGAMAPLISAVGNARAAGSLFVAPSLGIVTSPAAGRVSVRPNTFFGR
jgi:Second Messenger Oligonucleotide or Dinucleotide Synthetase domain